MASETIDLYKYRPEGTDAWRLPPWGHTLSKSVMPLFISAEGVLFPVGTAFALSRRVVLFATAAHNLGEAVKKCWKNRHVAFSQAQGGDFRLSDGIGVWVLYNDVVDERVSLTLRPLESAHNPSPTDVLVASPKFFDGVISGSFNVTFAPPVVGETVRCVGYTEFQFPAGGISLSEVSSGTFDWGAEYRHELWVFEGEVTALFLEKFTTGFVSGPCFAVDTPIPHGLSGGPVFNSAGVVCGINSAGATTFFGSPMSLVSMLFPLLATSARFIVPVGDTTINATKSIPELVAEQHIRSNGTELTAHFTPDGDGMRVGTTLPVGALDGVFEDFGAFQEGRSPTRLEGPVYRLKKSDAT